MLQRVTVLLVVMILSLRLGVVQAQPGNIIEECAKLLPANRPIPSGADAPSIRIVQPRSGVIFGETLTIAIDTPNFDVTAEGRHWHLWVNGQLQGMVYQPTAIIDLPPGDYQICASLGNSDHADIGMPAGVNITLQAAAAGTPTPTLSVSRDAARVQPEGPSAPQILLIVGGGLVAAIGGWWFGQRVGRKPKA